MTDDAPQDPMLACRQAFADGRLDDAERIALAVLGANPGDVQAHFAAGLVAYARGDVELAEGRLLKASLFADNGLLPLTHLAMLALEQGRYDECARYLERALDAGRSPDEPAPWSAAPERRPQRRAPAAKVDRQPVVGVGLPVYSGGDLFAGAIEAVLNQTFGDLELVILDTGDDEVTRATVETYRAMDDRIRYVRTGENIRYVGTKNNIRVMQASQAPFYMWAAYDDRHHPTFVERTIARLRADDDVGMVYSQTHLVDAEGRSKGVAQDDISTTADDPVERYLHVLTTLGMCNAWYGLYRRSTLEQTRSFFQHRLYRSYDNLFLAELALRSKIEQVPEVLFTRGLTRPRQKTYAEQNADVIGSHHPEFLDEGITLPMVRLVFAHLELLSRTALPADRRAHAAARTIDILGSRLGQRIDIEIDRALNLVSAGVHYACWDGRAEAPPTQMNPLEATRIGQLIQRLTEAAVIRPHRTDVREALDTLRARFADPRSAG